MQWTEVDSMTGDFQRTTLDAFNRFDRVHDIQDRQFASRFGKPDAATHATLAEDDLMIAQQLHDFV